MPIKINSYGGPAIWLLRRHCSSFTSKIMLSCADRAYSSATYEYIRYFNQQPNTPLFCIVNIETVNRCNGKCAFCPANTKAERRLLKKMTDELFQKIIDELVSLCWQGQIFLNINNEPFIDTKLIDRAKYVKEQLGDHVTLSLFTNGTLLDEQKLTELSGVLDILIINNYSRKYRLNEGISKLYRYVKQHPEEFQTMDISIRRRYSEEILGTRAGSSPNKPRKNNKISSPCLYPYTDISIFPDGTVGLCCNDCLEVTSFGNLQTQSLKEIWESPALSEARRTIGQGRTSYAFCKECDVVDSGFRKKLATAPHPE